MTAFQTRHLVVNGVHSPVLIGGTEATGEAVVFVHGNPDAGSDWEPLMKHVAEFAAVVAPDMPGFGGADKDAAQDYTLAAYGAHLGGVIDQLGIDRVHLVAHDFGGPFALTWAAANPGKVASVTLINTGVLLDYRWHRLARVWRIPVVAELFMRATTRRTAHFVIGHDNPGLPEEWLDRIVEHLLPAGTKRAVLRVYRSTQQKTWTPLSNPCATAIPTRWWCSAPWTSTSRSSRPNASAACSRAHELKSCPVSVTGRGSSNPTRLPGSSFRSCVNGWAQPFRNPTNTRRFR